MCEVVLKSFYSSTETSPPGRVQDPLGGSSRRFFSEFLRLGGAVRGNVAVAVAFSVTARTTLDPILEPGR